EDPVREIAAVRPAGDAEPVRIREPVGRERLDAREDVPHRARAPVPDVRLVELAAVALRAAGVRVEDADPARREELELEDGRPAIERVRAAVDLGHERRGAPRSAAWCGRPRRQVPALDPPTVHGHPALDRLAKLDLVEARPVEIGPAAGLGVAIAEPEVAQLR